MAQVERKRVVETKGTLPDGREVKRVVDTERVVASGTETRAGATGHGASTVLWVSVVLAAFCLLALWYYFFT
jgi:hypothetical protein